MRGTGDVNKSSSALSGSVGLIWTFDAPSSPSSDLVRAASFAASASFVWLWKFSARMKNAARTLCIDVRITAWRIRFTCRTRRRQDTEKTQRRQKENEEDDEDDEDEDEDEVKIKD